MDRVCLNNYEHDSNENEKRRNSGCVLLFLLLMALDGLKRENTRQGLYFCLQLELYSLRLIAEKQNREWWKRKAFQQLRRKTENIRAKEKQIIICSYLLSMLCKY